MDCTPENYGKACVTPRYKRDSLGDCFNYWTLHCLELKKTTTKKWRERKRGDHVTPNRKDATSFWWQKAAIMWKKEKGFAMRPSQCQLISARFLWSITQEFLLLPCVSSPCKTFLHRSNSLASRQLGPLHTWVTLQPRHRCHDVSVAVTCHSTSHALATVLKQQRLEIHMNLDQQPHTHHPGPFSTLAAIVLVVIPLEMYIQQWLIHGG